MYTYTPKRRVGPAGVISLSLIVAAILLYYVSQLNIFAAPAILQLIATAFAVASIFILSKFILLSYTYSIAENDDGTADLLIAQISGKKATTVARVSLSDAVSFRKMTGKSVDGKSCYNYTADLFPAEVRLLVLSENGERITLKLQADDEFARVVEKYINA